MYRVSHIVDFQTFLNRFFPVPTRHQGYHGEDEKKTGLLIDKDRDMSTMDSKTIEKLIKDLGLPGRLVEVTGRLITVELLDDRSERFERHELGVSEFCDLLLDWRQKLIEREVSATAAKAALAKSTAPAAA